MDVYHKVLAKLYETTGGKSTQIVDLKDLVRKLEFHGNYTDIYEYLCREGWVAEDSKTNFVKITHWGIAEVKKTPQEDAKSTGSSSSPSPEIIECLTIARDFAKLIEKYSADSSEPDKKKIQAKFAELERSFKGTFN